MSKVYVFDPTIKDSLSKVRGIGRYLKLLKDIFPSWKFVSNLKKISYESVFLNPFFNFFEKPLISKRIAQKQVAVIHDLIPLKYPSNFPPGLKGKLNIFLNKKSLKNYDLIITDSYASQRDIVQLLKIDDKKVKVIYPFFLNNFRNKKTEKTTRVQGRFVLYVGDATWNKNLVNLAKAIKIIDVTAVFVGKVFEPLKNNLNIKLKNKWQEEFVQFSKEVKGDKRFVFTGFVSDKELIKFYDQARVNILLSRDEGFGFSYLEAATLGCPSVLSDINIFHEIAQDSALFTSINDIYQIANSIGEIYFNQDLRDGLGKKARERALFFNKRKFKKEIKKVID